MESKFYKSIGEIAMTGSSVNGPNAFLKPGILPLRAKKDNRSIDNKPVKPAVGPKLGLRSSPKEQPLPDPKKIKRNQKRVADATTTPRSSSTSTTTTTTSTPTSTGTEETETSTTMAKRTTRPKNNRSETSTSTGGRRGDTPFFTSSTFTEPGPDMTAFNVYNKDGDSIPFIVQGVNQNVSYIPKQPSPSLLRPDVASGQSVGGEISPKLLMNMTSFYLAITDAAANTITFYNTFLTLLFNRLTIDIMRVTRGVVPSFWTSTNFRTAMSSVCRALEYFYCLDSIISFQNISVSGMSGSRSLEIYGNYFNTSAILIARDNLRRYLQGCWFPPGFSLFLRGFFQYYRTSNLAGQSNIFRYNCSSDFVVNLNDQAQLATNITATVATLQTLLSDSNTVSIMGLLSNTHPIGIINGLPKSAIDAVYSEDMLEVFANEPTLYHDVNSANTQSVVPISYNGTSPNDIPYYTMRDPKSCNGTCFALQIIPVTTLSSGQVYTDASKYFGIRRIISAGGAPDHSNKHVLDCSVSSFFPRSMSRMTNLVGTGVDTHLPLNLAGVSTMLNCAPFSWQRVYYDNQNAPSTLFSILCSTLYGTAI